MIFIDKINHTRYNIINVVKFYQDKNKPGKNNKINFKR